MTTMDGVMEHLRESASSFAPPQVVGIFLQGSQNYGVDTEDSDIDTKMILTPAFEDICFNRKPISTTHVRENNEHTDWKDIRLMLATFRKQNINFIEILFTDYKYVSPLYESQWLRLVDAREDIGRYNPHRAVKAMMGVAMEKYHAMEHPYPSKIEILSKYGYDPKQLHHLLRIQDFMQRYIDGEPYESCLRPRDPEHLKAVKQGLFDLAQARSLADLTREVIFQMEDNFCKKTEDKSNPEVDELLDDVQKEIMKTAVSKELM